jgi:hypothetical protein
MVLEKFEFGASYLEKVTLQHTEKHVEFPDKKTLLVWDINF